MRQRLTRGLSDDLLSKHVAPWVETLRQRIIHQPASGVNRGRIYAGQALGSAADNLIGRTAPSGGWFNSLGPLQNTIISPAGARALILEVVMDTDISEAADRREWLMTAPVICMECGSNNIELTDPGKQPAKWKCRKCAVRFDWEPSTRSLNCLSCYPKMCRCP